MLDIEVFKAPLFQKSTHGILVRTPAFTNCNKKVINFDTNTPQSGKIIKVASRSKSRRLEAIRKRIPSSIPQVSSWSNVVPNL
jgi:hypothetical protein